MYKASKHVVTYRALRRAEFEEMVANVGFVDIEIMPDRWEIVLSARKPER